LFLTRDRVFFFCERTNVTNPNPADAAKPNDAKPDDAAKLADSVDPVDTVDLAKTTLSSQPNEPDGSAAGPGGDPEIAAPVAETAPTELTIRLDHFLQALGVPTGGQAKQLIQAGNVMLNGQVETRRRKKLREGDEVELDGETFEVVLETE